MADILARHSQQRLTAPAVSISSLIDFLMVGGLTFLVFPLFYIASFDEANVRLLTALMILLSFLINYPHFMHSYQVMYTNFGGKLKKG